MPLNDSAEDHHGGVSIRDAASRFGLEARSWRRLSGGFSGAAVFQIADARSRHFAIRLVPLELSLPEQRLDLLRMLLCQSEQPGQTGIAVPLPPVRNTDSPSMLFGVAEHSSCVIGNFRVLAEPWIDGRPTDGAPNPQQLTNAIDFLSSLHQRLRLATSELPRNDWFFVRSGASPGLIRRSRIVADLMNGELQRLLKESSSDCDPEFRRLAIRTGDVVRSWLPQLKSLTGSIELTSFALQPILRDVWKPHVLFLNDDVSGVIDVTSAASDHPVLDCSRLFRSWFSTDHASMRAACQQFVERCKLDFTERQLLQTVDACSTILSPITWLKRRTASSRGLPLDESVLSRMNEVVRIAESFQLVPL